jgi:hypothetical protein
MKSSWQGEKDMKKVLIYFFVMANIVNFGLLGCSKSEDAISEKGKAKTTVEEAPNKQAEEIRKTLRTPIEKATAARDAGDERTREIDEAVRSK